jgi:hypothetical protein
MPRALTSTVEKNEERMAILRKGWQMTGHLDAPVHLIIVYVEENCIVQESALHRSIHKFQLRRETQLNL